jgi:hypothetical protein
MGTYAYTTHVPKLNQKRANYNLRFTICLRQSNSHALAHPRPEVHHVARAAFFG